MRKIGALEAGGTKMVLAVYTEEGQELDRLTLPTLMPEETLPQMAGYFREAGIDALGVGSFGPLCLDPASPEYGYITTTPKPGWKNAPLLPTLLEGLDIPAAIDTDVNAAAIAEYEQGAARGADCLVYVTVGTGIGGGALVNGQPVHGLLHPEMGHMLLRPLTEDPLPDGVCPYHKGCLEGLASGPALAARSDGKAKDLPDDHPLFRLEADYLAQMCHNLLMILSPKKIILGGGVMTRSSLLEQVRRRTGELLGDYLASPEARTGECIVLPELFPVSGLVGAYELGKRALLRK